MLVIIPASMLRPCEYLVSAACCFDSQQLSALGLRLTVRREGGVKGGRGGGAGGRGYGLEFEASGLGFRVLRLRVLGFGFQGFGLSHARFAGPTQFRPRGFPR